MALTLGALKLAQKKTLVQELYCIETLARVDTLCLDKTGTITEGTMCVEAVESYPPVYDEISGEAAGNKTESGESKNDRTESSDLVEVSAASEISAVSAAEAIAKRMGVRFFHHGKSLKLAQRRTARKIRRKSGRLSISWKISFLC